MTHKDNEWFRGKPEQTGNYIWGCDEILPMETRPNYWPIHAVVVVDRQRYCEGWWVRVGDLYPIPPVPVPRPEKVDTPVLVRDKDLNQWLPKHLAGWTEDGKILTWFNGGTSWSRPTDGKTTWNQWKLPEEE